MLFLLLLMFAASLPAQEIRHLTILHSNDLHARLTPDANHRGGFAYLATLVRTQREGCQDCLYLNAGDLAQGTPVSTIFHGEPVFQIGNLLKFDAAAIGNHEFDYGYQQAEKFERMANYPMLSANIVDSSGKLFARKPYVIKKVNGMLVAIIGGVMSDLEAFLKPKDLGPWHSSPVKEAVEKYANELREKADVVIVLAHISPREGSMIIKEIPQVNIVVEGHDHRGRAEAEVVDGRVAVGCTGYGTDLCRLDVDVDVPHKKLVSWKWTKLPVDSSKLAAAPDVEKLVAEWEKKVAAKVDTVIGESMRELAKADLVSIIEKATLDQMHADFTSMNSGGVRDVLHMGPILERYIWNMIPFDNVMMVAKVPGSKVPKSMRKSTVVDPAKEYTIALSDFLATNPISLKNFGLTGVKFEETDLNLRDVMINWVKKTKVIR